jgi:hypothetical protein
LQVGVAKRQSSELCTQRSETKPIVESLTSCFSTLLAIQCKSKASFSSQAGDAELHTLALVLWS